MQNTDSIFNSVFNEQDWLIQIKDNLDQDLEDVTRIPCSIFQVPDFIMLSQREAYTPQVVALGPYHHFKTTLYHMETYKLAAAKRAQKKLQLPELPLLVKGLEFAVPKTRASYDKYINVNSHTLTWIMAIDGLFLLELLQNKGAVHFSSPVSLDSKPLSQNVIIQDVLMLENQIPFLVLDEIMNNSCFSAEWPLILLADFCAAISPFSLYEDYQFSRSPKPKHLLDLLYQLMQLKGRSATGIAPRGLVDDELKPYSTFEDSSSIESEDAIEKIVWNDASEEDHIRSPKKLMKKPIHSIQSKFQAMKLSAYRFIEEVEQDSIPSAVQLGKIGIKFCISSNGFDTISFNKEKKVFALPGFTWKPSCEILMRNLVAYEIMVKSDTLTLTKYTELMHRLVRSTEDVELLKKSNIISGEPDSFQVLKLFTGLGRISSTKCKTSLDETSKAVSDYYNKNRNIKVSELVTKYVKLSWQIIVPLAAAIILVLVAVQVLYDAYKYPINGDVPIKSINSVRNSASHSSI